VTRRRFLKSAAGSLCTLALSGIRPRVTARSHSGDPSAPNVLILVFDAFSARHASFLGYERQTTPNLSEFAERATVYHRHYSAGNFTNPGTASLLTGTYPWTHRAFHLFSSVSNGFADKNIFRLFANGGYHTIAYTHNLQVTILLHEFRAHLAEFIKTRELCRWDNELSDRLFFDDYNMALWRERLFHGVRDIHARPTSLLTRALSSAIGAAQVRALETAYRDRFPKGLPTLQDQVFLLEDVTDWLIHNLSAVPQPFLAYFHVGPPHDPYRTRSEFVNRFVDGWEPPVKQPHAFSEGYSQQELNEKRRIYDEFIAYADAEFGRLYRHMARSGLLDRSYLAVTSDHGEMFERGIWQHLTPTLYEPVVQVPLLLSAPGQTHREDVYVPTSGVDLMPTLLSATGQPVPDWLEGQILPPFAKSQMLENRSVYVVEAKSNHRHGPLAKATVAMVKGPHKLIHYFGYKGYEDEYELYDLSNDPEEMHNLYPSRTALAQALTHELQDKIREVNEPYRAG
jgi:arylsulfatase A-like enzyme